MVNRVLIFKLFCFNIVIVFIELQDSVKKDERSGGNIMQRTLLDYSHGTGRYLPFNVN